MRWICLVAILAMSPPVYGQAVTRHSSTLRLAAPANARVRTTLEVTSNVPIKIRLNARTWREPWHPAKDVYADSHRASWNTITANTRAELEIVALDQSGRTQTKHVMLACGTVTRVSFEFESIPLQLPNSIESEVTVPPNPDSVIIQNPTPVTVLPSPVIINQPPAQQVEIPCPPAVTPPTAPTEPTQPTEPTKPVAPTPIVYDWAALKTCFWVAAALLVLTLCVYSYWKWRTCQLWRQELCMRQRRPRLASSGHAHVVGAPNTVDAALGSGFEARPEDTLGGR